jgi:hypothetical protein
MLSSFILNLFSISNCIVNRKDIDAVLGAVLVDQVHFGTDPDPTSKLDSSGSGSD